jgi:hypothetical protein
MLKFVADLRCYKIQLNQSDREKWPLGHLGLCNYFHDFVMFQRNAYCCLSRHSIHIETLRSFRL